MLIDWQFCRDSVRFRSFEDDLVDDQKWRDKDKLVDLTGLTVLKQPIKDHLDSLEQELEDLIDNVNHRIELGDNEHFKIKKNGPPLFDTLKQVDIGSVLDFVNRKCHWMDALEHVLHRYVKQGYRPDWCDFAR